MLIYSMPIFFIFVRGKSLKQSLKSYHEQNNNSKNEHRKCTASQTKTQYDFLSK